MSTEFSDQRILITGGGTGIGAAMARAFADAGAEVVIAGRTEAALRAVAESHERIRYRTADVTDPQSVEALFEGLGPLDVVIANAGAASSAPVSKTSLADWQAMLDVNLTGVFLTLQAGLANLAEGGRLMAVASTAGLKGYPYVAPYCAAKHGVIGLVKALAQEVARKGITVNALCPGFTETPLLDRSLDTITATTGLSREDATRQLTGHNPQGRLIQPDDVARTALWLASPGARAITGQAISISGGEQ
ncbi:SDR family NAD(P)-dependent oxidoreductase [Saccharospirillum salsuginis]|uniref:3-hydroxyacyl-CoA dehydrogenase n=1 Tax=Saccharospirillum salsuginis TaxID=418750 RepID=A0A918KPS5_9GAMM|nr:SDR family NAD(P)-dependent oxidoreductase [Saccharospirillum salsuginis]GGX68635.1 3-hydroxyacyl-CoA dehydrogenase [Saccharospirillum salsuginis]